MEAAAAQEQQKHHYRNDDVRLLYQSHMHIWAADGAHMGWYTVDQIVNYWSRSSATRWRAPRLATG